MSLGIKLGSKKRWGGSSPNAITEAAWQAAKNTIAVDPATQTLRLTADASTAATVRAVLDANPLTTDLPEGEKSQLAEAAHDCLEHQDRTLRMQLEAGELMAQYLSVRVTKNPGNTADMNFTFAAGRMATPTATATVTWTTKEKHLMKGWKIGKNVTKTHSRPEARGLTEAEVQVALRAICERIVAQHPQLAM